MKCAMFMLALKIAFFILRQLPVKMTPPPPCEFGGKIAF